MTGFPQRLLVYEYLTGGGCWHDPAPWDVRSPLLREGLAMRRALLDDLLQRPKTPDEEPLDPATRHVDRVQQIVCFQDVRLGRPRGPVLHDPRLHWVEVDSGRAERVQLDRWARRVDGVVLIAPETGGRLLQRCQQVQQAGGVLFSPEAALVAVASDKQRTARHLQAAGIPVPRAVEVEPEAGLPSNFSYPAVLKPVDGCGSEDTRRVECPEEVSREFLQRRKRWRLEAFCDGIPASVALLCGPRQMIALPACRQRMAYESGFHYLGGQLPLAPPEGDRARQLAQRVLESLPPSRGYVGVDLVLDAQGDGERDVVLEVNPRLTTSYAGLRHLVRGGLALRMIQVACGDPVVGPLQLECGTIEFDSDGTVREPGAAGQPPGQFEDQR